MILGSLVGGRLMGLQQLLIHKLVIVVIVSQTGHVYIYIYIYTCIYVYTYIYVCVCICMYISESWVIPMLGRAASSVRTS